MQRAAGFGCKTILIFMNTSGVFNKLCFYCIRETSERDIDKSLGAHVYDARIIRGSSSVTSVLLCVSLTRETTSERIALGQIAATWHAIYTMIIPLDQMRHRASL
jgi:hypothetical protein